MNLYNTTGPQDRILETEFKNLEMLEIDYGPIESILEDLDDKLSRALREKAEADAQNDEIVKELQVRISELEDRVDDLERQRASLENELGDLRERTV